MPVSESPQVRRDRITSAIIAALLGLTAPSVTQLIYDTAAADTDGLRAILWFFGTTFVGAVVPFLYWAPYRALGFIPYAAIGWLVAVLYGVLAEHWPGWVHGLPIGLIAGALARGWPGRTATAALFAIAAGLVGIGVAWAFFYNAGRVLWVGAWVVYLIPVVAVLLVLVSWLRLFRPLFELSVEPVLSHMYKMRGHGPGIAAIPRTGPCLIIANHACWLDPLFLSKVLPRPTTPMMTARFYDLPVLRRLLKAFGVIRVPERAIKKDTPEIQEAIAALDRGECVVIFPEGYLRRTEDRPLRRFGQGVWQILQARPDTPVFACWIEGGWGSYTSYHNGPPTKNKKRDYRRPIGISISAPVTLPQDVLAGHMPTRIHLMNLVLAARLHLGLPPLPAFELPAKGEEKADEEPPENGA
jgi:1-acyl-sn-glycerol-3-phosphate acyltransferase